MVAIYSTQITPRLLYVCKLIFKTILNVDYKLTDKMDDLTEASKIINYSADDIGCDIQLIPEGLLFENELDNNATLRIKPILQQLLKVRLVKMSVDFFAVIFYLATRYEEYLDFDADEHGRFQAEQSLAYSLNIHDRPIVDEWAFELANFMGLEIQINPQPALLTIDVDTAWYFKNKGFLLSTGILLKRLLSFQLKETMQLIRVWLSKEKDPADNFEYLGEIEKSLLLPIQYFILTGKRGKYDNPILLKRKAFRKLINEFDARMSVGVHPSYRSNESFEKLETEYYTLNNITQAKVSKSRQHYLKFEFPNTFRNIIKLGVCEEYSMGWGSQTGFRAGVARPFHFFDVLANQETHLQFIPFMAMDRTLKDYLQLRPDEAEEELKKLNERTQKVGGQFCMLWHNDSLSNIGEWQGWRKVFEEGLGI